MPIKTKRWVVPAEPDDGLRVLICRYRPRGVSKAKETWDVWLRDLAPSPELFAARRTASSSRPATAPSSRS